MKVEPSAPARQRARCVLTGLLLLCAPHAHAHFKLLEPASWVNEDALGGPQKGSPCGPGNDRPLFGDDRQPLPLSHAVTTYHAGETITVQWDETVYHPGYFRIALAPTQAAAATAASFPDPALTRLDGCQYDHAAVASGPHDNVLADGLYMATQQDAPTRSFRQQVKLPDAACEACSLQVMQVMEGHPGSSCFYYHCADIRIVAATAGSAVAGASADSGGGTAPVLSTSTKGSSGGCSIAPPARAGHPQCALGLLLCIAAWFGSRRRARNPR